MSVLKNLFSKKMRLITIVLIVAIGLGVGALVGGKFFTDSQATTFSKDGSIVVTNAQAESNTYSFVSGTKYSKKYNGNYEFKDSKGNNVELEKDNFLFYSDSTYSSLTKGVVLNTDDLQENKYVNHYSVPELMEISGSTSGYTIAANEETIQFKELIWKISDTKYMLLANSVQAKFSDEDIRDINGFVEFNYIDDGVIQIITQDNVWQTVSKDAQLVTDNGTIVHLADQLVEHNGIKMLLSKLVIDASSNIELSPLEQKKTEVPEFNVNTTDGDDGSSGNNGNNGNNGNSGNKATNGYSGVNGNLGSDGNDGDDADDGNDGEDGTDATNQSSFTTEIPTVQIKKWSVSATGFTGTYSVTDKNEMMDGNLTLKLYEDGTGEEIACVDNSNSSSDFSSTADLEVDFKNGAQLKPDTEYQLSISGQYLMDGVSTKREFVVKTFYTDSLGVVLDKDSVTVDSATVSIDKKSYSTAKSVTVYLLTPEQAAGKFDPTDSKVNYITQTYTFKNDGKEETATLKFDDQTQMHSNTVYTARVVVTMQENGETQNYISQQALFLATLKQTPTLGSPSAIANRQSWGFELSGGNVTDPDSAITSYIYRVYDSNNDVVKDIEVAPAKSKQTTMLYLDGEKIRSGQVYRFKVIARYNDNEKDVEIESAVSNDFTLVGSQLPAVSYQDSLTSTDTSSLLGNIVISKNGSSIDTSESGLSANPIRIDLMCEGIYEKSIIINDPSKISEDDSQIRIAINESGLKSGRVYRMDVSAYVDVHDSTNYHLLSLGHVTAKTRELKTLRAKFEDLGDTSKAFSKKFSFESAESSVTLSGSSDANDLSQVILRLYDAETNKQLGNEVVYTDEDTSARTSTLTSKFVTSTTTIDETTFGLTTESLTSNSYYIQIQGVYDYTKTMPNLTKYTDEDGKETDANVSGYVNEYPLASKRSETFTRTAQPPTLPTMDQISSQITATAILNQDAATYGGTKNTNLPDNAIVGYYLEFGYTNNARLARKLHLYAFDSKDIDGNANAKDLIYDSSTHQLKNDTNDDKIVDKKEFGISSASYSFPKVAILFGSGNSSIQNGVNVVYSDKMNRGHFYTFAYGVDYAEEETIEQATKVYPYSMDSFASLSTADQNKYVLSSTSKDTPKVTPTVYSYLYKDVDDTNKVELKYAFKDVDNTFGSSTNYKYNGGTPTSIELTSNQWSSLRLAKPTSTGVQTLEFEYNPYVTSTEKATVSTQFYYNTEKVTDDTVNATDVRFDFDTTQIDNNIITLRLTDADETVTRHTAGVDLTFTAGNQSVKIYRSFVENSGNKEAIINLSSLSKIIGKGNITINAKLLYDNGNQGWYYAIGDNKDVAFAADNQYLSVGTTQSISPSSLANGSLFRINELDENKLDNLLNANETFKSQSLISWLKFDYSLSPTETGLSMIDSSNTARNAIPKELGAYSLSENNRVYVDNDNTNILNKIDSIKPSAAISSYEAYTDHVSYDRLAIYGFDQITEESGDRKILVDIYNDKFTLQSQPSSSDSTYIRTVEYTLPKNSVSDSDESLVYLQPFNITGLDINKIYYMTIRAKVGNQYVDLITAGTNSVENNRFRARFQTAGKVDVSDESAKVKFDSYRNKYLDVKYNLSQTTGFRVEYTVLQEDGSPVMKDGSPLVLTSQYGTNGKPYVKSMSDQLKLDFDTLGREGILEFGRKYKLAINLYVVDNDGNDVLDSNNEKMKANDEKLIPFEISTPTQPFVFDEMWADADEDDKMTLHFNFNVSDQYKMIMTDTGSDEAYYYAKLWKVEGEERTDVSDQVSGEQGLVDSDGNPVAFKTGTQYTFNLQNPGISSKYQLILYSAIDTNNDGKADGLTSLEGSITQLTKDDFEANKSTLQMYTRNVYETPSSTGITLGTQSIAACSTDNTKAEITYKNAVGLNNIDRVEYSLSSQDGVTYTNVMNNTDKQAHPLFVQKTGGYFTLTLDTVLQNKGTYNVTVTYYRASSDGKYEKVSTYSDIYVY